MDPYSWHCPYFAVLCIFRGLNYHYAAGAQNRSNCYWPETVLFRNSLMKTVIQCKLAFAALFVTLVAFPPVPTRGVEILNWNTNQNRITADIKSSNLIDILEQIAA